MPQLRRCGWALVAIDGEGQDSCSDVRPSARVSPDSAARRTLGFFSIFLFLFSFFNFSVSFFSFVSFIFLSLFSSLFLCFYFVALSDRTACLFSFCMPSTTCL